MDLKEMAKEIITIRKSETELKEALQQIDLLRLDFQPELIDPLIKILANLIDRVQILENTVKDNTIQNLTDKVSYLEAQVIELRPPYTVTIECPDCGVSDIVEGGKFDMVCKNCGNEFTWDDVNPFI